jgi:tetratricopeptide (TPR) repeat protein
MNQNVDEGLALLRSAAEKKPDDFGIRQRLIEACFQARRPDEAVHEFAALVKATPDYPQAHFDALKRASMIVPVGDLRSAFERATKAAPADWVAWYGLGFVRQLVDDQDGAADAFKAGIKVAPRRGLLQYNLGVALMDKPLQAEIWLRGAIQYSPKMAEPHYALGILYMTRDRHRAADHFREYIRLAPPHEQQVTHSARMSLQMLGEGG